MTRRAVMSLCKYNKIITTCEPLYLVNKITFRIDVHNISHKSFITSLLDGSTQFERSFTYDIFKQYNKVLTHLKNIQIYSKVSANSIKTPFF